MTLQEFATEHRLRKPEADECGDLNIFGERGDIYAFDEKLLCVTILRCPSAQHWNEYRERAKGMGLEVTQNGDSEGTFLVNPQVPEEAELAIEAIRPRRKRNQSPEQLQNLNQSIETRRSNARKARLARQAKVKADRTIDREGLSGDGRISGAKNDESR